MTVNLSSLAGAGQQFLTDTGSPLTGGKLYSYIAGTTTPQTSYTNAAGTVAHTNPIILNAAGRVATGEIWITSGSNYKFVLYTSTNVLVASYDNITGINDFTSLSASNGASLIGYLPTGTVENALNISATASTRASAITTTFTAGINYVKTNGYLVAGDAGDAVYARVSSNPNIGTGGFQSADGAYWRIVTPSSTVRVEQFGGKADWVSAASPGTDNWQPLMDALATVDLLGTNGIAAYQGPRVLFGVGNYYFSQTVAPRVTATIEGLHSGQDSSSYGTMFQFPAGIRGVVVNSSFVAIDGSVNTEARSAQGCTYIGIGLTSASNTVGDGDMHGWTLRARANLIRCHSSGFPGHGFAIIALTSDSGDTVASTGGNANGFYLERCINRLSGRHGLYIRGNNANAGLTIGFQSRQSGLCGVYDGSGLGNQHYGVWISGDDTNKVGRVINGGRLYLLISGDGAATTPGTNDLVWCDIGVAPASGVNAWSALSTYEISMPIYCVGSSTRTGFHGGYQEGRVSHLVRPATVNNWQGVFTRYTPVQTGSSTSNSIFCNGGIAVTTSLPPANIYGTTITRVISDVTNVATGILDVISSVQDGAWRQRILNGDLIGDSSSATATQTTVITGVNTLKEFGRTAPVPYVFCAKNFALTDSTNSNNYRIVQMKSTLPTSGEFARGEILFRTTPSAAGKIGWSCTTGGIAGSTAVFKEFGVIDA